MTAVRAQFYDGATARRREVELEFYQTELGFADEGKKRSFRWPEVRVVEPIGRGEWVIELPEGGRLECSAGAGAALRRLGYGPPSLIRRLERAWPWAAGALLGVIVVIIALLAYGVPWMASRIAASVPEQLERGIADQGLALMDRYYLEPSKLDDTQIERVRGLFGNVVEGSGDGGPMRLEFRLGGALGANALAIPGGVVVITDELLNLAANDSEISAVLAHEVGHLAHRHGLRIMLQGAIGAMVLATVTGDLSSISALAASVPTLLLQTGYSRSFEREADEYAFGYLRRAGLDPQALSSLLKRIESASGSPEGPSFLSTHPRSEERTPEP